MKSFILAPTLAVMLGLTACSDHVDRQEATETLAPHAWRETLEVDGEIKAAANTPLTVPGTGWDNRALIEMVPDGSAVKKGQVIARFDAPQARMELSQAETELLRKALGEAGLSANALASRAEVFADNAKVQADLGLSERYAGADLTIFTRNQILDALQDTGFLKTKHAYLDWKNGQIDTRDAAERAVLASQTDSVKLTADQRRKSLAALDLIAPHDGVFLLSARWDGSKPQIGANIWSGQPFGLLPDMGQLVAHFSVAEEQAFGLKAGLPVRVRLAGTGTELDLKVTKVGSNASSKSSESPVKYSDFDAAIDHDVAMRLNLQPGQALRATVSLIDKPDALTVPNIALTQEGTSYALFTVDGSHPVRHLVELGMRGSARSEIKAGLSAGARVLLLPDAAGGK
jgi:multidrug efflux pump subunit AcrA (membrane-fusion protein)